jgi:hypothetical protein
MGLETDGGTAATDMTGAAGGNDGFDMAGAVDSIGSDLFGGSNDDGSADLGNDTQPGAERDGGAQSPAPSPAPTAAPAASPAPTAAPAAGPATPPAAPGPVDLTKPPPTWRAEAQAEWAKLSPTTQAEIHKREQDMWKGIEGYKNEATFSKAVKQVLAPVAERLAGRGVGPLDFLQALSGAHLQLSDQSVPVAQRTVTAIQMLKSYGIEVSAPGAASAPAGAPEYVDPQVAGLQQELAELKSRLNGQDQQRAQTVRQQLSNDLNAFAADPAHPYFDEVADDIVHLCQGVRTHRNRGPGEKGEGREGTSRELVSLHHLPQAQQGHQGQRVQEQRPAAPHLRTSTRERCAHLQEGHEDGGLSIVAPWTTREQHLPALLRLRRAEHRRPT